MSLLESIEADKAELAKLEKEAGALTDKAAEPEQTTQEASPPTQDTEAGQDDQGDVADETKKQATTDDTSERPDASAFRAQRRKIKELEQQIAALAQSRTQEPVKAPQEVVDAEPDKTIDPDAWYDWRIRQAEKKASEIASRVERSEAVLRQVETERMTTQAEREFMTYEQQFASTVPDYEDASRFVTANIYQAYRTISPQATNEQLVEATRRHLLTLAANALRDGHENPVAPLYAMAKQMGYTGPKPKEGAQDVEIKQAPKGPNFDKIAENKKRTMPINGGAGKQEAGITKEQAANMSVGQFAALAPEVKARLMSAS